MSGINGTGAPNLIGRQRYRRQILLLRLDCHVAAVFAPENKRQEGQFTIDQFCFPSSD